MTRIEEIIGMKNPCKNCPKDIEDCAKTHSLCEKGDKFWRKAAKVHDNYLDRPHSFFF